MPSTPGQEELQRLLRAASHQPLSDAQREKQIVSIAYGNLKLENDRVTRTIVAVAAAETAKKP